MSSRSLSLSSSVSSLSSLESLSSLGSSTSSVPSLVEVSASVVGVSSVSAGSSSPSWNSPVGEAGPSVGYANSGSGGARTEPYMAVWPGALAVSRCQKSGAILKDGEFHFNYAKEVHCLQCPGCKQWEGTLCAVERSLVTAIWAAKEELCAGSVTELEIRDLVDAQVGGRSEVSLVRNVWDFLDRRSRAHRAEKINEMARRMVEWEAEEDSGMESVDSME